jgi:hypothetical protein
MRRFSPLGAVLQAFPAELDRHGLTEDKTIVVKKIFGGRPPERFSETGQRSKEARQRLRASWASKSMLA